MRDVKSVFVYKGTWRENYYELTIFNFSNVNQCAYRGLSLLVNLNE